jgi:hypothetical protein
MALDKIKFRRHRSTKLSDGSCLNHILEDKIQKWSRNFYYSGTSPCEPPFFMHLIFMRQSKKHSNIKK